MTRRDVTYTLRREVVNARRRCACSIRLDLVNARRRKRKESNFVFRRLLVDIYKNLPERCAHSFRLQLLYFLLKYGSFACFKVFLSSVQSNFPTPKYDLLGV